MCIRDRVYGMITSVSEKLSVADTEYNVLATDVQGNEDGSGDVYKRQIWKHRILPVGLAPGRQYFSVYLQ